MTLDPRPIEPPLALEPPPISAALQVSAAPPQAIRAVPARTMLARAGEEFMAWLRTLASAAVYATLIITFGFQVARVDGQSMVPTLHDQDRLIVNKLAYEIGDPQIGDIVMLLWPPDPDKAFVKRVVAGPGDTIKSVDGHVFRNGIPLPDDFIPPADQSNDTWGPTLVEDAHYFVMGDHRNNSSDSRSWGFVPKKYILGKVMVRWWPITDAHVFSGFEPIHDDGRSAGSTK